MRHAAVLAPRAGLRPARGRARRCSAARVRARARVRVRRSIARHARHGTRARHRASRGREGDREAAEDLRLLHRQTVLVASRRSLCRERYDRNRRPRCIRRQGTRARVLEALTAPSRRSRTGFSIRCSCSRSCTPRRRPYGEGSLAYVRARGRTRRVRALGPGVFENEYVKERGVWKIQTLHLYTTMYTPYEAGGRSRDAERGSVERVAARSSADGRYKPFPAAFVVPSITRAPYRARDR